MDKIGAASTHPRSAALFQTRLKGRTFWKSLVSKVKIVTCTKHQMEPPT
jgi:hypothetical protein